MIKGTSISKIEEISRRLPLQRGAYMVVDTVKSCGAKPVIITGGFAELARAP